MKLNKTLLIGALSLFAASGLMAKPKAKEEIPGVAAQPASFFYTGKPYDADLGNYVFAVRNFDPQIGRWTSADPSGFPDGVNNMIYVNNAATTSLDRFGKDIYIINNQNAVGKLGHSAMISGNDSSGYTYQSYGTGNNSGGPSGSGQSLATQNFSTLSDAMASAASNGYTGYAGWNTDSSQDQAAQSAMSNFAKDSYNVANHNCQDAVNAGLDAAGADYYTRNVPKVAFAHDKNDGIYATMSGKLKKE